MFMNSLGFIRMIASTCMAAEKTSNRRSFDVVFHPEKYPVFEGISDAQGFEDSWANNRTWVLSNLVHAAYYEKDKLYKMLSPFLGIQSSGTPDDRTEFPLFRFYDVESAQGFLLVWADKAILSFRGTQSNQIRDLLADIFLIRKPVGEAMVHSGFLGEVNKLWEKHIAPDLKKFAEDKPVWVTGHSLGAALATVAGMRYEFEDVVTFGEPRVGFDVEKEFKAKGHTRVVNGNDPVTKIPLKNFFFLKYRHHGEEKKICDPVDGADIRYDHAPGDYSKYLKA
jgi:triacylglycerol lipase